MQSDPRPETRDPRPETRDPKPETRNPRPETRNPKHHNLLVPALPRLSSFLAGMVLGFGTLAVLNHFVPGVWLPVALAILLGILFSGLPWLFEQARVFWPLLAALSCGIATGWLLTASGGRWLEIGAAVFGLVALAAGYEAVVAIRARPEPPRVATWWLVGVIGMIWIVSAASSSYAGAGGMIHWVVSHLGFAPATAQTIVFFIRKTIHFSFYGFLGFATRTSAAKGGVAPIESARFGFTSALLVASFDEMRQSTQPGRTGSFYDVLLDLTGAAAFLVVAHLIASRRAPST
jgi:VanZ family protein